MAVSIADLFISVGADVSAAQAGLTALDKQLNDTSSSFQRAAPAALLLAGAGAAVGAGLAGAVGVAATFEKQMSGVRAVMSPNEVKQFGSALDDLALKLGADTTFSAQQAAAGIEELIKAGVPAKAVLEGAGKAALDLAAATGTDVATAATIAAQAMNAFKIPVSQLPTIVDRLAGVVNVSAADMGDLRFGLQAAGAVAATVGLSFEDTAAALGIFANNGLRGQDAGTSLKTMLINLVPNTKQQTEAFKRLGLITADGSNAFFDAQGHVKGLAQVSGVLQNALKGMTDQQKLAALQVLFGTDAMRAAAILAKTGAAGVNEFTDQVKQVSAADQAAERLNNFLGRLEQLGGSLQTVQIIIGRFFTPALGAVADTVKTVLNAFSDMSPQAKAVVTAFVSIGGAVAAGLGGLVLLAPIVATIGPAFGFLGAALVALAPVMLAVGAAAAVLFAAWQANLFGIRELVQRAFDAIPGILDQVGSAFAQIGPLWESTLLPAIQTIGNQIERTLIPVFNTLLVDVLPAVQRFGARISSSLTATFDRITSNPFFINFALAVEKAFSGNFGGAVDTFIATIGAIVPGLGGLIQGVRTAISGLFDQIGPILGNFGLVFQKVFDGDIGGALDTFRAIIVAIAPVAAGFVDLVGRIAEAVGGFAGNLGEGLLTFFRDNLPIVATAAATFAGNVGEGLTTFFTVTLPPILDQIARFTSDVTAPLVQFFREHVPVILDGASKFAGDIGAGMVTFFTVDLPQIVAQAQGVTPATFAPLVDFFQTQTPLVITGLERFGGAPIQPFIDFFNNFGEIQRQVQSLGPLFSAVGDFADSLNTLNNAIFGLQAKAVDTAFGPLGDALKSFVGTVEPLQPAVSAIGTTLGTLGQFLQPVADILHAAAGGMRDLAGAITEFSKTGTLPLPNIPGFGGSPQPAGQNTGVGLFRRESFNPNADANGGAAVVVNFNAPIDINGAGGLDDFIQSVAVAVAQSVHRVTAPPDNSGIPSLQPSFV